MRLCVCAHVQIFIGLAFGIVWRPFALRSPVLKNAWLLLLLVSALAGASTAASEPPNFVIVYVDDLVDGVRRLVDSDCSDPTNIGTREYVSVRELVQLVASAAGKEIDPVWVPGPVGVQNRNFSNDRIESLGFDPKFKLAEGLAHTYRWIANQVTQRP